MAILSRVNDSKDGQIQSKLERSVCGWGLNIGCLLAVDANGTAFDSGNLRSSVKPAGRKRMPGTNRGSPRWRLPKTRFATSVSGRMTTRAATMREKRRRNQARDHPAGRRFLSPKSFFAHFHFFPPSSFLSLRISHCKIALYFTRL